MKSISFSLFIILLAFLEPVALLSQEDLNVLKGKWLEYTDAPNSLYQYLSKECYSLLDKRDAEISSLKTPDEWKARQKYIRETLMDIVGPFPEKTPLNAKVVRTIDKENFRIEHIIFESQPGFFVTSSLFIPSRLRKGQRAPAIIYCSGHSEDGYRSAAYQHVIINLVQKGFIVFAFDPVGQGERLEYYDPATGKSKVGGPTKEHSQPGAQAFLAGSSQAMYMIWDGIRAVDYLISRKEVDPARIGITGRSGGGTQSAYIAAFDERILAAAPENYITNYRRLLQTIGPQDAEQNLFHILARGLDHPDFLIVRAPKPALMITTTNDMFSIQGAMETEEQVAKIYMSYGSEGNFSRVEDFAGHASTLKNREAMYDFFMKHLSNPGNTKDEETRLLSPEDLRVTATGQVSTALKGETVYSLNLKKAEELNKKLDIKRADSAIFYKDLIDAARSVSGYVEPAVTEQLVYTGIVARSNYFIRKYFIKGEGDYVIPFLLFKPSGPTKKAVIYLNPSGKSADAGPGGIIEDMVNEGYIVLAPDLIGYGETADGTLKGDAYFQGVSHNLWYTAMIAGRSLAGIRAGDVIRLANVLRDSFGIDQISGVAKSYLSPVILHAAAFSSLINDVKLIEPQPSFISIVKEKFYDPGSIMNSVPGALLKYDLPDLERGIIKK